MSEICKMNFLKPCPTVTANPIRFMITNDKEKQQILTTEKMELGNFFLKTDLDDYSIMIIVIN